MDVKPTYKTICQQPGCKNEVTGQGTKVPKRTCFDCKTKRHRASSRVQLDRLKAERAAAKKMRYGYKK